MRRLGILGGTFDPPHLGHLILAETAADRLGLDALLFVPAADPPHKRGEPVTPVEHRLAMLALAIQGNPRFSLSRVDVDRPGPHYSVDMVGLIAAEQPGAALYFVMGGDSLRDLPRWHQPAELLRRCKLAVMRRPDDDVTPGIHETLFPGLAERLVMIDSPLIGVSSSAIVEAVRRGESIRYLVPDAVRDYIETHQVYGNNVL